MKISHRVFRVTQYVSEQNRKSSSAGPSDFGDPAPSTGLILIKGLVTLERI